MGSNPAGRATLQSLAPLKPGPRAACGTLAGPVIHRAIARTGKVTNSRSRSPCARWSSSPCDRGRGWQERSGAGHPRSRSARASSGKRARGVPHDPPRPPRRREAACRRCGASREPAPLGARPVGAPVARWCCSSSGLLSAVSKDPVGAATALALDDRPGRVVQDHDVWTPRLERFPRDHEHAATEVHDRYLPRPAKLRHWSRANRC